LSPPAKLKKAEAKLLAREAKRRASWSAMERLRKVGEQKANMAALKRLAFERAHQGKGRIASRRVVVVPKAEPKPVPVDGIGGKS
jgi:hypothetical protein